ncbi:MAG: hypothetical protein AUJ49_13500 [Desulfovibrionaceae bacterium CG1_02_65_16]|nr:MAG: hypothetical protein AUJ49_13500 [Desulfovibrionaceae bacterium CG1_02_65_16]
MLFEALHYARARLGGEPNPHGHLTELVGIWARHNRQRLAWAEHLARARALCLAAAEAPGADPDRPDRPDWPGGLTRRRTAVVYGAGTLYDVPLERLASLFRRVVLADMAFLPRTRKLARALGNVELLHVDLTRALDRPPPPPDPDQGRPDLAASDPAASATAFAAAFAVDLTLGLDDLDFAYSANLLSQLPLALLAALRQRVPAPDPAWLDACGAAIVRAHLAALAALPCPVCLVTDVREHGLDERGAAHYEEDLLYGVNPGLRGETWTWRLAPRGEADRRLDIERVVLGVADARPGQHEQTPDGGDTHG